MINYKQFCLSSQSGDLGIKQTAITLRRIITILVLPDDQVLELKWIFKKHCIFMQLKIKKN